MPISAQWYKHSRDVLVMSWSGSFAWDEAFRAQDELNALLNGDGPPCALILDFPESALHLTNALTNGRLMLARRHRRLSKIVLVSPVPYTRALGQTLARLAGLSSGLLEVSASLADGEARLRRAGFLGQTTEEVVN